MAEEITPIVLEVPSSEIKNWDDFEKLVHHAVYNEARIAPEEHPFIISESSFANPATREKLTQIMFETFNVPALSIIPTSVLAVNSVGLETGLSLHFGETSAELVPVVEGVPLRNISVFYPITGGFTSGYLDNYIAKFTLDPRKPAELREAKKQMFVSQNPTSQATTQVMVKFGDTDIDLADIAWKTPEIIFYPQMVGLEQAPLAITVLELINNCPSEVQQQLLENIIISGGNANFPGFASRLKQDLQFLLEGQEVKVDVKSAGDSKYTSWLGGSVIGSLSDFISKCYLMEQYDEHGPAGIHSFVA